MSSPFPEVGKAPRTFSSYMPGMTGSEDDWMLKYLRWLRRDYEALTMPWLVTPETGPMPRQFHRRS